MLGADRLDELLHLELRARIEARGRLVEQEQGRRGEQRPGERHLLLHPAREVLHRLAAPLGREADARQDHRDLPPGLGVGEAVEPRRVGEVLLGAHPLEEARLDRDAVDEPPHRARAGAGVVAEDPCRAAVGEEQGREQPDERRLARAVPAEDGDALAAGDRERQRAKRRHAPAAREAAVVAVAAAEVLAQVARLDRRRLTGNAWQRGRAGWYEGHGHSLGPDENGIEEPAPLEEAGPTCGRCRAAPGLRGPAVGGSAEPWPSRLTRRAGGRDAVIHGRFHDGSQLTDGGGEAQWPGRNYLRRRRGVR